MLDDQKSRDRVLKAWRDKIFETYPLKPNVPEITHYINDCTQKILDKFLEVYNGGDFDGIEEPLDDLMRYLAVDAKMTPGQSIEKILYLKTLLLDELSLDYNDFLKTNRIVDKMASMAFDIYTQCREHIFELRLNEKDAKMRELERMIEFAEKASKKTRE